MSGLTLKDHQVEIHACARAKGWWDTARNFPELIALMHSELSEALESWRNNESAVFDNDGKPDGWGVELGDCMIRILDAAEFFSLDMDNVIRAKMLYNWTREHHHGGKRA